MAGRKSAKNEIQDPSLPSKKRARWRLIGAAVLACAAVIILPFALESEPRRELGDVDVKMPARTELGKMERVLPTGKTVPESSTGSSAPDTRVAADSTANSAEPAKPMLPADRVKPVVIDSKGEGSASAPVAALPPVKPLAPVEPARLATASQANSRSTAPAAAAKPKPAAKATPKAPPKPKPAAKVAKPVVKAPPIPERRTDPNGLKSASPSGYVVQIGAFSNRKSANAQVARGKKLGFEPYTEKIKTTKGTRIRVRVGPYLTREQADAARSKLKRAGIDTALIAP